MGLRFRKSINICKGVKLNVGTKGLSVSLGMKGLHHTIHTSGRMTSTIGLPGTGLSYVKNSSWKKKKKKSDKKESEKKEMEKKTSSVQESRKTASEKDSDVEKNTQLMEEFNDMLDDIRSIHEVGTEPIDWNEILNEPQPFDPDKMGPREQQARGKKSEKEDSLFSRFFDAAEEEEAEPELSVEEAAKEDRIAYGQWEENRKLAKRILDGDIDAYFEAVQELEPFEDILDYGSDFDIGTDIPDVMEVEFHARTSRVVPDKMLTLTSTGKLSSKAMTKTLHYDIAQDYICSCVIRVAREMFAILPVNKVLVHVEDEVETSSGTSTATVLSVLFDRRHFEKLDLDSLDPSETLESFDCHMNFKKTQGLKPVERVEL